MQPQGSSKTLVGASRFRIIQTRSPAVPAQVGEALNSRDHRGLQHPRARRGCYPALPGQAHGRSPGPKSSRRIYPGFLSCLTGFPELHRSQGRSHAGVKGHEEDSAPLNARESLGARGAWPARGLSLGPREGEATPLVAPPTVNHVIAASLGPSFQRLPLVHVTPLGHVGGEVD